MSNTAPVSLWTMRAIFVSLALMILLGNLLPLQTITRGWAGPDFLLGFALAWSVRRPDFVPIPMLAAIFLLADLLLSRPPGLAAALMLLACYDMQTRMLRLRDAGFAAEWARAAFLIVGVAVAYRVVLSILFVPPPPLMLSVFQTLATALIYPAIVGASALLFGVRLSAPGDIDSTGHRL